MQFADEHPSASVLGVDLSPIQPGAVPPNCSFRVDDAENTWIPEEKFDFIHSRAMLAGFRNWPRYFQQAFDHLKPGGYIELQDFYFPARVQSRNGQQPPPEGGTTSSSSSSKLVQWCLHCMEAGKRTGLNLSAPNSFPDWLREAGFVDIHVKWYNWPLGPWAKGEKNKNVGRWALANFLDGLPAANALFTRVLGWTYEEVQVFVAECKEELRQQKVHVYLPVCFAYARKPREGEVLSYASATSDTEDGRQGPTV
jgi:SAM-dependent methyltransferase